MGLTKSSVGAGAAREGGGKERDVPSVALLGNPNVGKSSVFNGLTGMHQHTGNWHGKTVNVATGRSKFEGEDFLLVDLPGTYSLLASSPEEEAARNYLLFESPELCVCVCDATNLERGLPLVLQAVEITPRVLLCVNLMDEAKSRGITVDADSLSARIGVPVVCTSARDKKSLAALARAIGEAIKSGGESRPPDTAVYPRAIEEGAAEVAERVEELYKSLDLPTEKRLPPRFAAMRLLEGNELFEGELYIRLGREFTDDEGLLEAVKRGRGHTLAAGIEEERIKDVIAETLAARADAYCREAVGRKWGSTARGDRERRIDKLLTGRAVGYPIMIGLLLLIFWLTVSGANYPSSWLSALFLYVEVGLRWLFAELSAPWWLEGLLIDGVYGTLASVVSVMLPPMAIFFPLFTVLEDVGYLPRVAYNLDRPFARCGSCGKQALTMCMGFGCNAAGVVGCRIIDSPRERMLATLTNALVPCNGKFPTLIAIITMFCALGSGSSLLSAALLTLLILLGVLATFAVTKILSVTLFKGTESGFVLEMPPFRRPQVVSIIVRSVFDRTLFVLGRAAAVAAPMGAVIWLMANLTVGGDSLLSICSGILDPLGRLLGLDGVILIAFILGFPANEIVLPLAVMAYTASGSLGDVGALSEIHALLAANGWTWTTAVSVLLFSMFHWPCSTTVMTVKKETGSTRMAFLSAAVPTVLGVLLCIVFNLAVRIFS